MSPNRPSLSASSSRIADNPSTNEQLNGMKNDNRKKINGFKNEKFDKKSLPPNQPAATKPKTPANQSPQQQPVSNSKSVPLPPANNAAGRNSNGLPNKVV